MLASVTSHQLAVDCIVTVLGEPSQSPSSPVDARGILRQFAAACLLASRCVLDGPDGTHGASLDYFGGLIRA
jgi:hypothetical protein